MSDHQGIVSITGLEEDSPDAQWAGKDGMPGRPPGRPMFHRVSYPPRVSINALLISLLCAVFLVFIGFVPVNLPSPPELAAQALRRARLADAPLLQYTFLAPVALMVGAFLGPFLGMLPVLLFLLTGLFAFPVFAGGGGWHYLSQPGFGYLLGMLPTAWLLGRNFHRAFKREDRLSRSFKVFGLAIGATVLVHAVGLAYMTVLALIGQLAGGDLVGWALRLTLETAPYDILATFVLLCLVRQLRLSLWLILY